MKTRAGWKLCGQEPDADPACDHGAERADVVGLQDAVLHQVDPVDGYGAGGDRDDPGGETVETVDEVDGVGHPDHPQGREERGHRAGEDDQPGKGELEPEHRHAEEDEHHRGEDLAGHLRGGGHVTGIVDEADGHDHGAREHDAEGLGGSLEEAVQGGDPRGDDDRDQEGDEHGDTSAVRGRPGVDPPLVGLVDEADTGRDRTHGEGADERADGGDAADQEVPPIGGHSGRRFFVALPETPGSGSADARAAANPH